MAAAASADPKHPTGAYRVYVTNEGSGDLSIIDPVARAVVGRIALGKRPRGIVASPDQRLLYIALSGSPIAGPGVDESRLPPADKAADGIAVFDIAAGKVLRVLRGISDPEQVAVSPDGATLYVASEDSGRVMFMDAEERHDPRHPGRRRRARRACGLARRQARLCDLGRGQHDRGDRRGAAARPRPHPGRRASAQHRLRPLGRARLRHRENDASLSVIDVAPSKVARRATIPGETVRPMGVAVSPSGTRVRHHRARRQARPAFDAATLAPAGDVIVGERPWGVR